MNRQLLAYLVQILGLVLLAVGVGLFSIPGGLITAGVSAAVFGIALERGGDDGTGQTPRASV